MPIPEPVSSRCTSALRTSGSAFRCVSYLMLLGMAVRVRGGRRLLS
jgi:hypothetical protein